MKCIATMFVAAATLMAVVSAIPAIQFTNQVAYEDERHHTSSAVAKPAGIAQTQFGGKSSAAEKRQLNDPEFVCAWALTKWRGCHEAAGCDRECPAGEACYQALCATPSSTDGNACNQLRANCGTEERNIGENPGQSNVAVIDKRQSDGDSKTAQVPHLVDIWAEKLFTGRYTWTYYSEMLASACVDVSAFPVEWSSLKVNPQDVVFHCTFFDLPNCKDGAKFFSVDGTAGYEASNLRFVPGNWYHNIRSLKCQPGKMPKR